MRLGEMQEAVDAWVKDNGGYWDELAMIARLAEEVGELSREYLHRFGPKPKKPGEKEGDIAEELADVLWIVTCMANQQGIDLDVAFQRTVDKIRVRDTGRFTTPKTTA